MILTVHQRRVRRKANEEEHFSAAQFRRSAIMIDDDGPQLGEHRRGYGAAGAGAGVALQSPMMSEHGGYSANNQPGYYNHYQQQQQQQYPVYGQQPQAQFSVSPALDGRMSQAPHPFVPAPAMPASYDPTSPPASSLNRRLSGGSQAKQQQQAQYVTMDRGAPVQQHSQGHHPTPLEPNNPNPTLRQNAVANTHQQRPTSAYSTIYNDADAYGGI